MVDWNPNIVGTWPGYVANAVKTAPTLQAAQNAAKASNDPAVAAALRQVRTPMVPGYSYGGGGDYFSHGTATNPLQQLAANAPPITPADPNSAVPTDDEIKYAKFVDPYAKFDPAAMAAAEFNPQFSLLDQMAAQAKTGYGKASADIQNAWNLLSNATAQRAAPTKAAFAKMQADNASGYGNVTKNTDAAYEAAKAEILANAKRTGTMDTVGSLLADLANNRMELNQKTGSLQGNWAGFENVMGQQAQTDIANDAESAKWGGINAKSDYAGKLQAALNDIANKRLQTQAAEGAAKNKYAMDITGARTQAQNAWDTLQTSRAGQAIQLAQDKLKAQQDAATAANKPIDTTKLTPTEYLSYLAKIQYPNVGDSTRQNAIKAIQDTFTIGYGGKRSWANAADFVAAVLQRNPNAAKKGGDAQQLAQMAQDYYAKISGGANRPYGQK